MKTTLFLCVAIYSLLFAVSCTEPEEKLAYRTIWSNVYGHKPAYQAELELLWEEQGIFPTYEYSDPMLNHVVSLNNKTNNTINVKYRWGKSQRWQSSNLKPGYISWFSDSYHSVFHVRFDSNLKAGEQRKAYNLDSNKTMEAPSSDISRKYHFSATSGSIDLFKSE